MASELESGVKPLLANLTAATGEASRAAVSALQGLREASRRRSAVRSVAGEEEEESLFIG
jgi:hypothetical protein